MTEPYLAIQVVMMPRDVNPHGTIFGGVLLAYIDQAGAIGAINEVAKAGGLPPSVVDRLREKQQAPGFRSTEPDTPPT